VTAEKLDPFYLIVDGSAWLRRLLPCGVRLVQLRIKDLSEAAVRDEIVAAKALCAEHGAQLIVNDYWRAALDAGCDFVHLGQSDLEAADLGAIARGGVKLGVSTHDEAELERALDVGPAYVALGPIYPTVLKQMAFAPQGLGRIREWKKRIGALPLVAIGGLSVERAQGVFEAGADCAAVVTDVLRHADPEARTRAWLAATRGLVRAAGE
jgi:thiamine-phosphate pyrophosphorylase